MAFMKLNREGSRLWRIAGKIYGTVFSDSVTIFSANGSSLNVSGLFTKIRRDVFRMIKMPKSQQLKLVTFTYLFKII